MSLVPSVPASRAARAAILLLVLVCLVRWSARAEALPVHIGTSVAVLTGPWKFHPGDNPAWAATDFDDSGWGVQDVTPPQHSYDPVTGASGYAPGWTAQGHAKLAGYAWYRIRLNVTNDSSGEGSGRLALSMPLNFDDAYQVYANGQLIGEFGQLDNKTVEYYNAQPRAFALPENLRSGLVEIAIRFWMDKGTGFLSEDAGGLHGPPMLGEAKSIDAMLRLEWDSVNRGELPNLLASALLLLVALLGFTLYWLDRREPAYLWLGLACALQFLGRASVLVGYYTTLEPMVPESVFQDVVLAPLNIGLWAMFWASWFRLSNMRRIAQVAAVLMVVQAVSIAGVRPPLYGSVVPVSFSGWLVPISLVFKLALGALLVWVAFAGMRKRVRASWLALVPIVLTVIWCYQEELQVIHIAPIVRVGGITLSLGQFTNFFMLAIVSLLLMERFMRSQREQELWRLEIEQARQVQQVLIPEALPRIPGFALASEYRPAQQVGGDFFQIVPLNSGGVLVVIGDVSGKGMPAAMTVSLLVGAVRTLVEFTTSPGEILAAINLRMIGRTQGGFTTCLILRVDPNGRSVLANAGHLAPYLSGRELETENGLPLGLSADAQYPELEFRLAESAQLTLLTDGVAEARNSSGELLGFPRTAAMTTRSAEEIARAAQEFGQQDDITVLTLKRVAVGEEAAVRVSTSVLAAELG